MTRFVPRPYQNLIRSFALDHRRANIFASPGLGKTSASIDIFDSLRAVGEAKRALVLAPKRVAINSWGGEIDKWRDSFGHLSIAVAIGTPDQRMAALRSGADITCINYDNIPWLMEKAGSEWPFDVVFADESTRLKGLRVAQRTSTRGKEYIQGQGSTRAKAIAGVALKHVRHWYNLTGSPAPNGLQDLWGQQFFVDGGRRLGSSFAAFQNRWFRSVPGSGGYSQIEPLPFAQREIEALLRETSITVDAKDWFPIEDAIERHFYVDLPSAARKHYLEIEKNLFTELACGAEVEVFSSGSKAQKLLQIANGIIYHSEGEWENLHDEKLDALRSIKEETNGENLLVAYHYKPDRQRILKAFPKARFLDDNPKTLEDWNAGRIPMLVCHPASAGHGLSLQHGGRILVDYSSNYNMEYDEQVLARVGPVRQLQSGYNRSVFRYRIVARDTIEQHSVLPRLTHKMSIQDSLKAAMKIRNGS